ncbi:chromate transporter-domain-containing protein [Fimicolochytrium jonesii]|uniref:chromate transporter-domain-containing protein n=1 Tax=Fimicolochytrium jonesii TaxID=1396493 RepID=UPI0022FE213F|nr:chromate transporter-domain-containing protein [Fimicolochytrium jonesii]KAI8817086.1 chromate transporter-domain-containing protein [Fimicolochytrium jonesii]
MPILPAALGIPTTPTSPQNQTETTPLLPASSLPAPRSLTSRLWEVTHDFLPLAFITFGGPPAHIAILHDLFVAKKRWLTEAMFAELLGISSALPGPASTQLAYTVAMIRDGIIPAILAFLIWSVPGGIVMGTLGAVVGSWSDEDGGSGLPLWVKYAENGLASTAVALVALAAYNLANKLCGDHVTKIICVVAAGVTINFTTVPWVIPALMVAGGLVSYAAHLHGQYTRRHVHITDSTSVAIPAEEEPEISFSLSWKGGIAVLLVWLSLFLGAILLRSLVETRSWQVLGTFYYVGSIIFGGGPVVIPLLYNYIVTPGWASSSDFLLGLAIINAMPGPNFNFAAYCGALILRPYGLPLSILGALLAWLGIFLPGLLIKTGVLPLWRTYRGFPTAQIFFRGANAAAVGLVFTATYLLWEKAIAVGSEGAGLGGYPVYVAWVGLVFVGVGFLKVPAPVMIAVGAVVGLVPYWAGWDL